jgi:hypothetical protein
MWNLFFFKLFFRTTFYNYLHYAQYSCKVIAKHEKYNPACLALMQLKCDLFTILQRVLTPIQYQYALQTSYHYLNVVQVKHKPGHEASSFRIEDSFAKRGHLTKKKKKKKNWSGFQLLHQFRSENLC